MRVAGLKNVMKLRGLSPALALALTAGCSWTGAAAQQAPQVLPYTMSTIAGPNSNATALTVGSACGNYVVLDGVGDGCPAQYVQVGTDPHDIRVDGKGNIYWMDNSSKEVLHKISVVTGLETVYAGSAVQTKVCATNSDKYGDGCVANDGVANSAASPLYTGSLAKVRGLGVSPNGDVYLADYTGYYIHKISAATGLMSVVAGTGASGYTQGPVGTSAENSARGVGVDPNSGVVYFADTGNNVIRMATPSFSGSASTGYTITGYTTTSITAYNSAGCGTVVPTSGTLASSACINAPEDAQVDMNGNVYIADQGNNLIEAIYMGKGTLPGISNPQTGYLYIVAGYNGTNGGTSVSYPISSASTTFQPTYPATQIILGPVPPLATATVTNPPQTGIGMRKLSIDAMGNLYIPDKTYNLIWFVDAATGYARLLAGNYNWTETTNPAAPPPLVVTATTTPLGCAASADSVGDGCPGPLAGMYTSAGDPANAVDNQGNLYFTDSQGEACTGPPACAPARLRKLLSGLNFGANATAALTYSSVAQGSSLTDNVFIHFGPGDGPAASGAYTSSNSDFVVGTANCETAPNSDTTKDCIVPITFTPSKPGNDTATLTITSLLGAHSTYQMTGIGSEPMIAIDPGNIAVFPTAPYTTSNAQGVVLDGAGNGYIADTGNNRILKYTASTSTMSIFAGTGTAGYTGDGAQATLATLKSPRGVAIDSAGNVYIADSGNNAIRKVTIGTGVITTYAGGSNPTVCALSVDAFGNGCPATQAILSSPSGIAADNLGQIYVSDTGNNRVRQISDQGYIFALAGGATAICSAATDTNGDGCPASQAIFKGPTGLAFDATGNFIIVADTGNNIVRKIFVANTWSHSGSGTSTLASGFQANPVSLVAGNGQQGGTVGTTAASSSLYAPTGVAVDTAEDVYIADTGDHSIQIVSQGVLSTLVGLNTISGTGVVPGSAASAELDLPGGVAVTLQGTLVVLDSGNNRILTDSRSQVTYNFGTVGLNTSSPQISFLETNIGSLSTTFASTLNTATGNGGTQITLTAPSGSSGCTGSETLAPGATCTLLGQFTPTVIGSYSETYTEAPAPASSSGSPSITLSGAGAVLTTTSSTLAQTSPTGTSQYGQALTITATVTASSCSTINGASCTPSGTVKFGVVANGTTTYGPAQPLTASSTAGIATAAQTYGGGASGSLSALPAGANQIVCLYGGDSFYASSSCTVTTITVAPATTTSLLSATPNNQAQYPTNNCTANSPISGETTCTAETLTATVVSSTTGVPTGNVTFYSNGSTLGCAAGTTGCAVTASLNSGGVATLALTYTVDANGNLLSDLTLPPGTYSLTCQYNGASNYATSKCTAVSFTVVAQTPAISLLARGCAAVNLIPAGYQNAGEAVGCGAGTEYRYPAGSSVIQGYPEVGTAQGSTTDATIFINASNTVAGTLTFACSGLPANSTCTFSPTTLTLTAGNTYATPVYTDMTLWTDVTGQSKQVPVQAGLVPQPSFGPGQSKVRMAMVLGWPLLFVGMVGIVGLRRKGSRLRLLTALAVLMVLCGSSLVATGCAGPGVYVPVLTPASNTCTLGGSTACGYPITVTVSGAGIKGTTTVYFVVSSPGIPGQQ